MGISIKSRDPDGLVAGLTSIEQHVTEQDRQINSVIKNLRPDPSNEDHSSVISGIMTIGLPMNTSNETSLCAKWLNYLQPKYIKLPNKVPRISRDDIISSVDGYSKSKHITQTGVVLRYANELIDKYYSSNKSPSLLPSPSIISSKSPIDTTSESINLAITTQKLTLEEDQSTIDSISSIFLDELKQQKIEQARIQQQHTISQQQQKIEQNEIHQEIINTMH